MKAYVFTAGWRRVMKRVAQGEPDKKHELMRVRG
jgi:hypothetical protein